MEKDDIISRHLDEDSESVKKVRAALEQSTVLEHSLPVLEETARIQQKVEHELTKLEAIKAYPKVFLWILGLVWVLILVGYDGQAGGVVVAIPAFREHFGNYYEGDYVLDGNWQSAISGAPVGGMAIGTYLGSFFGDRYGRKWPLIVAAALTIPFVVIEYVATTIAVFFAGKFLNSFCLGAMVSIGTTYIGELAPLALRAVASSSVNLALCIGPFICFLINNTTSTYTSRMAYRGVFIAQWVFAVTSLVYLPFIPESPYWYVMHDKDELALKSLERLYKGAVQPQQQFAIVKTTYVEAQKAAANEGSFFDLFRKANIKRTLTAVMPFFMQPMSGVAYVSSYSTYYYELSGFSTQESYQISCGGQALSIAGTLTSFYTTDRFGRRAVMLYAMSVLGLLNIITAGLGVDANNEKALVGASAFLTIYNYVYNSGIGPISYVIATEIPTSSLRAKTISIAIVINYAFQCMWGFVLPFMFNPDQANMGSKINFIFGAASLVSLAYFYYYLPETSHRSYEEIDEMFNSNVPPRKFKTYVCEATVKNEDAFNNDNKAAQVEHIESA